MRTADGGYLDELPFGTVRTHVVWTDRRDKTSCLDIFDPEDDAQSEAIPRCAVAQVRRQYY